MQIEFEKTILWSDSTIVLGWIKSPSNKTKTFVSHRIAEIQDLTNTSEWRHIPTNENPADIISRGLMPNQLQHSEKWWHGPQFLNSDEEYWPSAITIIDESILPEMKPTKALIITNTEEWSLFKKFSSLQKLQRVMAYVLRFIDNCKPIQGDLQKDVITSSEMARSLKTIIRIIQQNEFKDEFKSLQQNKDKENLLRVGGRIRNSEQSFENKHQLILPKHHYFTKLLIRDLREKQGHAGQQALLSIVRQKYWPVGAKDIIRNVTRNCIICFKVKPKLTDQFMGDLPTNRVTLLHPFLNTGVNYAGPVLLRVNRKTCIKAYIAIFVCMATKAIHIELVSDLTSKAYIAALSRFIARRGLCKTISSDNGTNFHGAKNELLPLYQMLSNKTTMDDISNNCAMQQIEFKFIPPKAPHMGGLWEAAVKVAKYHMHRIIGKTNFNFEELSTILAKIEAILNSRPLFPESIDPEDYTAITPGHFLIGRPLLTMIEPDYTDKAINRLKRWQLLQKITQHFWQRWSKDYLTTLQQRQKSSRAINLQEGMLVIIKEDETPVVKLCVLPVQQSS